MFSQMNKMSGITLGITAVMLSSIYSLFWFYALDHWSFERAMLMNGYRLGEFVLVWSPSSYDNSTDRLSESLYENRGSGAVWSLGMLSTVLYYFGRLQDYVMCDVVLLFTFSLYQAMTNFIQMVEASPDPNDAQREELWVQYDFMKSLAYQINNLFGSIIILIHFYNALTISYSFGRF